MRSPISPMLRQIDAGRHRHFGVARLEQRQVVLLRAIALRHHRVRVDRRCPAPSRFGGHLDVTQVERVQHLAQPCRCWRRAARGLRRSPRPCPAPARWAGTTAISDREPGRRPRPRRADGCTIRLAGILDHLLAVEHQHGVVLLERAQLLEPRRDRTTPPRSCGRGTCRASPGRRRAPPGRRTAPPAPRARRPRRPAAARPAAVPAPRSAQLLAQPRVRSRAPDRALCECRNHVIHLRIASPDRHACRPAGAQGLHRAVQPRAHVRFAQSGQSRDLPVVEAGSVLERDQLALARRAASSSSPSSRSRSECRSASSSGDGPPAATASAASSGASGRRLR